MNKPLRHFRDQVLKLSQHELAGKLGTSKASISRMETGDQPVSIDTLRKIASLSDDVGAKESLFRDLLHQDAAE